jgi:hypothetical protein
MNNKRKRLALDIDTSIDILLSLKNMECNEDEKIKRLMAIRIADILRTLSNMDLHLDKIVEMGGYCSKILESLISCNGVILESKSLYTSPFSAKEWEACSECRKDSIISFVTIAASDKLKNEDYINSIKSFDAYTKNWIRENCNYDGISEML